jgi:hypothetical protein
LRASEDKVLRTTAGPGRDEVAEGWRQIHNEELHLRFGVITAVKMLMVVVRVVPACGLADGYQSFRRTYCLHLQGLVPIYKSTRRYNPEHHHSEA